jgi:uncharacterized membrane protein YoaK (UPF0700 family)
MTVLRLGRPRPDIGAMSTESITFTLSFIAGLVDVTSFVLVNGLFAAHITGNIVVLAADLAVHRPVRLASALAVVVFIAVTAAFTVAVDTSPRKPSLWTQRFLWLQFAFLAATAVAAPVLERLAWQGTGAEIVIAVLAVAAMACQNALLHLTFKRAPSTAVMTGNIVASTVALVGLAVAGFGARRGRLRSSTYVADRAADRTDWIALWPLLLGFVAGCALGALAGRVVNSWAWTAPALVSAVLAVKVTRSGVRSQLLRDA